MTYLLSLLSLAELAVIVWLVHTSRRDISSRGENLLDRMDKERERHREEIAALHQARMEETADLLQRIQAPEQAVASHAGDTAQPDPQPVRLENDEEMLKAFEERQQALEALSG